MHSQPRNAQPRKHSCGRDPKTVQKTRPKVSLGKTPKPNIPRNTERLLMNSKYGRIKLQRNCLWEQTGAQTVCECWQCWQCCRDTPGTAPHTLGWSTRAQMCIQRCANPTPALPLPCWAAPALPRPQQGEQSCPWGCLQQPPLGTPATAPPWMGHRGTQHTALASKTGLMFMFN